MPMTQHAVEDLGSLKAVAHPLRIRILGQLRSAGPATASELGRVLGESSGSTSYHLRQLERFGFVDDDVAQPAGRRRRWRAVHDQTRIPSSLAQLPGGREHLDVVRRRQEELLEEGLAAWTEYEQGWGHSDYLVHLDPDDLDAMLLEIDGVIASYRGRGGSRESAVHVLALPGTTKR